jgi:hypothetical protein
MILDFWISPNRGGRFVRGLYVDIATKDDRALPGTYCRHGGAIAPSISNCSNARDEHDFVREIEDWHRGLKTQMINTIFFSEYTSINSDIGVLCGKRISLEDYSYRIVYNTYRKLSALNDDPGYCAFVKALLHHEWPKVAARIAAR